MGRGVYYNFIGNTIDNVLYGYEADPVRISHGGNYAYVVEAKIQKYKPDAFLLVTLDSAGQYKSTRNFRQLGIDDIRSFRDTYTDGDGHLYLMIETVDGIKQLYYIEPNAKKAVLCYTTTKDDDVKIYGLVEDKDKTTYLVKDDSKIQVYVFDEKKRSSKKIDEISIAKLKKDEELYYVLADGTQIRSEGNVFWFGEEHIKLADDFVIGEVWRVGDGAYIYNMKDATICSVNLENGSVNRVFRVDTWAKGITALSVDIDGQLWMIDDADSLKFLRNGSLHDITKSKGRPLYISISILVVYEFLLMFLALIIWYFPAEVWKMHISFLIRWGVILAVYFFIISSLLDAFFYKDVFLQQNLHTTTLVNAINVGSENIENFEKMKTIRTDARRYEFVKDNKGKFFYLSDGKKKIVDSLYYGSKYKQSLEDAVNLDKIGAVYSTRYIMCGKYYYVSVVKTGENTVRAMSVHVREDESEAYAHLLLQLMTVRILLVILWIIIMFMLFAFRRRISKTTWRIRVLVNETRPVRDVVGDEISAMNDALDDTAFELRSRIREVQEHNDAYERFLPKSMLKLLKVQSVFNITRETCAEDRLIMMTVSFKFAKFSYEEQRKEIYDRLNHVIERAGEILNSHEGMVLDYRHDGFTALFHDKNSDSVKAAIELSQEFQKEKDIKVHITIDTSMVMTGIVGTNEKYQPISISPSFSTNGSLLDLFDRFEAGILCTESASELIKKYDSRYIGKIRVQDREVRIYEIFEGDMPEVSRKKKESEGKFAEAIYAFYIGDYRTARAGFLEIVREDSFDGPAKYYLYLADKYEEAPPKETYLNI